MPYLLNARRNGVKLVPNVVVWKSAHLRQKVPGSGLSQETGYSDHVSGFPRMFRTSDETGPHIILKSTFF